MEEVGTTLGLLKPYVDTGGELSSDLLAPRGGTFSDQDQNQNQRFETRDGLTFLSWVQREDGRGKEMEDERGEEGEESEESVEEWVKRMVPVSWSREGRRRGG
jgi:hypothetical protein